MRIVWTNVTFEPSNSWATPIRMLCFTSRPIRELLAHKTMAQQLLWLRRHRLKSCLGHAFQLFTHRNRNSLVSLGLINSIIVKKRTSDYLYAKTKKYYVEIKNLFFSGSSSPLVGLTRNSSSNKSTVAARRHLKTAASQVRTNMT